MKLYFAPGACSLAPHIILEETGQTHELEQVDLGTKKTASGEEYTKINPKGSVPAIQLDDGQILTEVAVVLQYIADQKPEAGLSPQAGTMERYRLLETLNYISSEVHKTFGALFNPDVKGDWREAQLGAVAARCDHLSRRLDGNAHILGDAFSIADAYLFAVLNWSNMLNIDLTNWPALTGFLDRVSSRPGAQAAMKAEGLLG